MPAPIPAEVAFVPGSPTGKARWVSYYADGKVVLPCHYPNCPCSKDLAGSFSDLIVPGVAYPVDLVLRRSRENMYKLFYVAHRRVEEPAHPFADKTIAANTEVTIGDTGARLYTLGGIAETGSRACSLLCYRNTALLIDCGVNVANLEPPEPPLGLLDEEEETTEEDQAGPGLYPEFERLRDILEREEAEIVAAFLTHHHLDHYGGLPGLSEALGQKLPPIYGHRQTTSVVTTFLAGRQLYAPTFALEDGQEINLGHFRIKAVPMFHSTVGSFGYNIHLGECPDSIFFTGDFKTRMDQPSDVFITEKLLSELGPVRLMLCDGTNAGYEGWSGMESLVEEGFMDTLLQAKGRVLPTCFSTNLKRVVGFCRIATKMKRSVAICGSSFDATLAAADARGITIQYTKVRPGESDVIIIAGCQGNRNSAARRLSEGGRIGDLEIGPEDTVVISARPIPGRRIAVDKMAWGFLSLGAKLVIDHSYPGVMYGVPRRSVHASGHSFNADLRLAIGAVKPEYLLPHHCGARQMLRLAEIAEDTTGMPASNILLPEDTSVTYHL